jgi:hypothetical protein
MSSMSSSPLTEAGVIPAWAGAQGLTRCFVYNGPSMSPTFRPGDLLFVRPLVMHRVRPGDVVVFQSQAGLVVHRAIKQMQGRLLTRGDANRCYDPPVSADVLVGRVEAVERAGMRRGVSNGWRGRGLSFLLHRWRGTWLTTRRTFGPLYRRLRASPPVRRLLRKIFAPRFEQVSLQTAQDPVIKYLHRGCVVARWWPDQRRFECRKPYDLFLSPPDEQYQQ